jgi:hypothetical protein
VRRSHVVLDRVTENRADVFDIAPPRYPCQGVIALLTAMDADGMTAEFVSPWHDKRVQQSRRKMPALSG